MTRSDRTPLLTATALVAALGSASSVDARKEVVRDSRFFRVDVANQKILETLPRMGGALRLNLVSVTTDQPQYWPHEKVFLKVLMPGAPGASIKGTLQKRDASGTPVEGTLDGAGVGVFTVADGAQKRLQLGEYRLDVTTADGKLTGSTTFTVVEGALGAVSLAHPFERVTSTDQLDQLKAGWFLGNASGAGKRWGNGLSFKNQLRVANQPFTGEVEVHSRCMLPGCNGVDAGPSQKMHVEQGALAGTLNVGGHSGPFQIELITPGGTVRHQFEGSSHVERDMVAISGGMGFAHRAGMAPYENTVQVPGRQIYVESAREGDDALELRSVVARDGAVTLTVRRSLANARITLFQPKVDGTFAATDVLQGQTLSTGQEVRIPVQQPYTFVAAGGFAGDAYVEGWAVAFAASQLKVAVGTPAAGMPGRPVNVDVRVTDAGGTGVKAVGILEVFDNRAVTRNPLHALGSEIGESFRNVARSTAGWQDRTGIDEELERRRQEQARKMREDESSKDYAPQAQALSRSALAGGPAPPPPPAPMPSRSRKMAPGGAPPSSASPVASNAKAPQQEEAPEEVIRENEQKVVFCGRVETDAQGRAQVPVTMPPQTGRVSVRFVALSGLDHNEGTADLDVRKDAFVDLQLPRTFVPGARLTIPVLVENQTGGSLTLRTSGPGFSGASVAVGRGTQTLPLAWAPQEEGVVVVELLNGSKALDVRRMEVRSAVKQSVTWSRLWVDNGTALAVAAGETVTAYANAGALMRGMSMNMVTTMESWFGHAEALGARAATTAVLLAAYQQGLLPTDGQRQTVLAMHEQSTRDLETAFLDPQAGLFRPYPGIAGNAQWSAWVSASLHDAQRALQEGGVTDPLATESLARMKALCARVDAELVKRGVRLEEAGGFNASGQSVIPVEVDGKVLYRVATDDAVTRWAVARLVPELEKGASTGADPVNHSRLVDTFRFLKAFERVGLQQYLAEVARGLWERGDRATASRMVASITRGMILAQDPGMLQGPALLGGVYSAPRAMVRFLELLLVMGRGTGAGTGALTVSEGGRTRVASLGESVTGPCTVTLPAGAVARLDRQGVLDGSRLPEGLHAKATVDHARARVGQQVHLTLELPAGADPLEYVAIISVPSTVIIKQTGDILSDSRGVLIHGTQQQGGTQMQVVAAPFRGTRTLTLWLEGARAGSSPGWAVIRHVENPQDAYRVTLPDITVQ